MYTSTSHFYAQGVQQEETPHRAIVIELMLYVHSRTHIFTNSCSTGGHVWWTTSRFILEATSEYGSSDLRQVGPILKIVEKSIFSHSAKILSYIGSRSLTNKSKHKSYLFSQNLENAWKWDVRVRKAGPRSGSACRSEPVGSSVLLSCGIIILLKLLTVLSFTHVKEHYTKPILFVPSVEDYGFFIDRLPFSVAANTNSSFRLLYLKMYPLETKHCSVFFLSIHNIQCAAICYLHRNVTWWYDAPGQMNPSQSEWPVSVNGECRRIIVARLSHQLNGDRSEPVSLPHVTRKRRNISSFNGKNYPARKKTQNNVLSCGLIPDFVQVWWQWHTQLPRAIVGDHKGGLPWWQQWPTRNLSTRHQEKAQLFLDKGFFSLCGLLDFSVLLKPLACAHRQNAMDWLKVKITRAMRTVRPDRNPPV